MNRASADSAVQANGDPRPAHCRRSFKGWWWGLALISGIGLGVGGGRAWRWHTLPDRLLAGLPNQPDTAGKPAVLRELLERTRTQVQARATALASTAELGRLYHANGFLTEAEACWRLLRTEQSNDARWAYYLADLRRTTNDYMEMTALLQTTAALAPEYAPVWLRLGDLAFKTGDMAAAARRYGRRLELVPGDPYARLGLARIDLQSNRPEEARQAIAALVKDAPDFSPGQNLYAEMLAAAGDETRARRHRWQGREAGRFREAEDPWLQELNTRCHDPERLRVLGTYEFQINRLDRAKELLERAVQLAPENPTGYALLGDLQLKLGEPARARATLEHALGLAQPPSIELFANLGEAHRQLEDPAAAARVAESGLKHWPESFELYNTLGVALGDLDQHEAAIVAYREAVVRNPNHADARFNLGVSLLARGRATEAEESFRRALTAQPTFPQALLFLGRMKLEAGQLDAAAEFIAPLYEAHPGQAPARQLMAAWHLRMGRAAQARRDLKAAEQHYRAGLDAEPTFAELHADLGVLHLTEGRIQEALSPLETLRRLQPDNPQAALFLGQVYARLGRLREAREVLQVGIALADRGGDNAVAEFCREILRALPPG